MREHIIKVIRDLRVLNAFKRFGLVFNPIHKYYIGDTYKTKTGLSTDQEFKYKNKRYILKYFDGCFNPFLVESVRK